MTPYFCPKCGAELIAGMSFCRTCGEPLAVASDASERPTTILNQPIVAGPATDRLNPRPTASAALAPSPYDGSAVPGIPSHGGAPLNQRSGSKRQLLIVAVIILALLGLGSVVSVMRSAIISRLQRRVTVSQPVNNALVYPGSQTILNVDSGGGSGVLQLKTADPIDKVAAWYEANLKLTKTLKVGPAVVMKADNFAITIISDGDSTSIVIKHLP